MASATLEAKLIVPENKPRSREAWTLFFRILAVSALNRSSIFSSTAKDFTVFAPVMPSLKLPVIRELISRTCRLTWISFFWNMANKTTISGRIVRIIPASEGLRLTITTIAPTR